MVQFNRIQIRMTFSGDEAHESRKNENDPSTQVDVKKNGDNMNLKRRKLRFAESDAMCFPRFVSIQTQPQISVWSPCI